MMKTLRYAFARTLPIMAGYLVLGLGFGVLLQSKGYGVGWSLAMSTLIYAGSMQYVTIDLLAGGASLISAALMTLMVNARHLFYGISMMKRYKNTGAAKPYLIFALTDETYSVVCSGDVPEGVDQNRYYLFASLFDQIYWVAGSVTGTLLGSIIPFDTTGIDFSMTALFLVVMVEQWRAGKDHTPALVGLGVSLICLVIFGSSNFLIPSTVTVAEFLMDWLPKQCSKHKWAPKTYQSNLALIQNLIIPYIGEMQMQKLRPYHIEALYDTLSKTPCGQYVGGKRRDLSPKQQKRTLSGTTLHEVHQLLHNSFLLAVEWGILIKSPVPVEAPKKTTQERSIWEVDEMRAALDSMEDPILHLAVHLTLVGVLREGEVAGLTPEDIDFDAANGMGTFTVNRSMQRVQKDTPVRICW